MAVQILTDLIQSKKSEGLLPQFLIPDSPEEYQCKTDREATSPGA